MENYFVGIGAQKAGTTWLARYFTDHPQVGFSPIKELHYFDAKFRKDLCPNFDTKFQTRLLNLAKNMQSEPTSDQLERLRCMTLRVEMIYDDRKYKDYFNLLVEKETAVVGEITPSYSLLKTDGFADICRHYNQAKFLFIIRDPVDRVWSHLRFEERRRKDDNYQAVSMLDSFHTNPRIVLRTDYQRTLSSLYEAVNKENVCVAFFENLMHAETHEKELKKITDFLEIDYVQGDIEKKYNSGDSRKLDDIQIRKVARHFTNVYQYISSNFSDSIPEKWRRRMSLI